MEHYDAVVVGCGAMGSSVSRSLASAGMKVLTLERFNLNHEFGSSHGRTRIIRLAYAEDPRYVPMLRRAFASWKELEVESGKHLLEETGGLMIGEADGNLVKGVMRSAKEHNLQHKVLDGAEASEMFPAFRLSDDLSVVHEEGAGILFSEECVDAFVQSARREGGDFRFSERVSKWEGVQGGVRVVSDKGEYLTDRLVICAGSWARDLVGGGIPLESERQAPLWFEAHGDRRFGSDRMPIFVSEEEKGMEFYGIPDVGHGVKVGRHHGGAIVDPDEVEREVTERDVAPVRKFITSRLPGLDPSPIASTTCLYTNTPDSNFVLDFHPEDGRVVVVSVCSGHGFKFAGVVGEVVSELLTKGKSRFDISFLGIGRFAG